MTFESPVYLAIGLLLAGSTIAVNWRRFDLPVATRWLLAIGIVLLALAAGDVRIRWPAGKDIVVMVDLSASTRGADFLSDKKLRARVAGLVGRSHYRILPFPSMTTEISSPGIYADSQNDRTVFDLPRCDAILLFSDGQFVPPVTTTPIYPVIDAALEKPSDVAVVDLQTRDADSKSALAASVRANDESGTLRFLGTTDSNAISIAAGRYIVQSRPVSEALVSATITRSDGREDLWPENDTLSLRIPPARVAERWWVGGGAPPGWKEVPPDRLPIDAADYLSAGVVALNDISADDLSDDRRRQLLSYVNELGGSLVLMGGERSFAAGNYSGTELDALSPLASDPPTPRNRWILLVDASGSMAAAASGADGATRWTVASKSAAALLSTLPRADRLDIGHFAAEVHWWSTGKSVAETAALALPPADVVPNGPTNLEPALRQLAEPSAQPLPTQLLIITDADAQLADLDKLAGQLSSAKIAPHLLATAEVGEENPLRKLVASMGGQFAAEPAAVKWSAAGKRLLRALSPTPLSGKAGMIEFTPAARLNNRSVINWNRAWLKSSATALATVDDAGARSPVMAQWQYGSGRVTAAAFGLSADEANIVADRIAKRPSDPRFSVTWLAGSTMLVSLDAVHAGQSLNDLRPTLELTGERGAVIATVAMHQSAPGRYEVKRPAPRLPVIATVRLSGDVIDRRALAGRYPAEFEEIGNNRAVLTDLARRTGGRVIEPNDNRPIDFPWPARLVSLTGILSAMGAGSISVGALIWKNSG